MRGLEGTTNDSHNVATVTKAGDLDLLPPVAGSTKSLPNEVLLIIFKLLKKDQLKALRCVCRTFAQLVSPLLFDEIYVSPHRLNLIVFRQIADHHDLCQYPRTLIYDVQIFKDNIDPQEYYKNLCHQLHFLLCRHPRTTVQHVDKELEGLLRMAQGSFFPAHHDRDEYYKFSTCRIVQRGLELYLEKAKEQEHYNSGELLACLCTGLMRLNHVENVKFQYGWTDSHLRSIDWSKIPRDLRLSSSPLARNWSPFHLKPCSLLDPPTTFEFDNVIRAFSLTWRPMRVLNFSSAPSVVYEIFHSKSFLSRTFREHCFLAMCYLESLTLHIDMSHHSQSGSGAFEYQNPREKTLSIDVLAVALRHMPALRSLSLHGSIHDSGNGLISIRELFLNITMPALEVLELSGMLGSAAHICAFLRAQPRLRRLSLWLIELSEGTWAGLVDDMQTWLILNSLDLQLPLREDGGMEIWDEDSWDDLEISEKIEDYVLNSGGQNPLRAPR